MIIIILVRKHCPTMRPPPHHPPPRYGAQVPASAWPPMVQAFTCNAPPSS